ncbi:unnamed protein product, partial [Brassica oleracea]
MVAGVSSASNLTKNTPEPRSCLTAFASQDLRSTEKENTHVPNQRKQQKSKTSVGNDITNVDETFTYHTVETSENTSDQIGVDHTEYDEEEMADCDVDIEGIIEEIDVELEFDVSSQESTDSENYDVELDASIGEIKNHCAKEVSRKTKPPTKSSKCKSRDYIDEGDPSYTCSHCGAIMWYGERINRRRNTCTPSFSLCCGQGQVVLPFLKEPPEVLKGLIYGQDKQSKHFQKNLRPYNMVFSFTSLGGKVERSVKKGLGPDMFQLHGENYHLLGSLRPPDGNSAKFGQLYIADTENEVKNRANCLRDGRTYNTPTASEVAALIPGDFNLDMDKRDIVVQQHSGKLKRINEIHASYLALQYPLLFAYGVDGFRLGIKKGVTEATEKQKKATISMRQFFAYRLHERKHESGHLLHARRLFQQFLVDAYTTIESNRLHYLKLNQSTLRSDSFDSIKESESAGKTNMNEQGTEFVLPASFTGGPRYMKNNYLDAMTICKHFGFPDLSITFTCNPKWPELTRFLKTRKLNPEDRPEVICRMFKMKLESLMDD